MSDQFDLRASRAIVLVRLLVGIVFLSEGIQKLLYPAELAAGRFAKIGIPFPEVMGPVVAVLETVCGALVIIGLFTSLAAALLFVNISVAIISTKLPILLGHALGPFTLAKLPRYGVWSMLHESRTDLCMWLGSLFLIIVGAGSSSLDARRRAKKM